MCCPVYGMVHIKDPLLLIGKNGSSGFLSRYMNRPLPYVQGRRQGGARGGGGGGFKPPWKIYNLKTLHGKYKINKIT